MIDDFMKEAKKRAENEIPMTPAQKEIQEFSKNLYFDLKKGTSQKWIWTASTLLIKSIDPEITKEDLVKGVAVIDGMIVSVLTDFISEGTLIKTEVKK
jgi:hypothetical protein